LLIAHCSLIANCSIGQHYLGIETGHPAEERDDAYVKATSSAGIFIFT
jgi:hypothetical protein